ncbi:MAG: tyrosine-type recombinase/integrase [Thiomicrospira sp.]|uniref:tyrosine-type recombinase/integrase n=1 Tax=Thiomicrospira sp. TaxID=935 RepID=UPI0019E540AB|nr:tyrosine-type recombinase/integrase [Thiomicrospira sp.]MBE0494725.1 tyrosine-type recombinase/integrase [Thiomicrospira sp.]
MLNNTRINGLKPKAKMYRVADGNGLIIEVKPTGLKVWRYRCRINGLATMLTIGHYPTVTLAEARRTRDELREQLRAGIDPRIPPDEPEVEEVKTFDQVYKEWFEHNQHNWLPSYADDVNERCQNHLLPYLGNKKITELMPMDVLRLFKHIEMSGKLNMLKKVRGYASRVFRYAVGMGYCALDPTRDLPIDVFKKEMPTRYAHVTDPKELGLIMRKIEVYSGTFSVKMALRMAPHVFLRPTELVTIEWENVNFEERLIRIQSHRMKMKRAHIVPMSNQVYDILCECHDMKTGKPFVFEGPRNGFSHITPDSLRVALRKMNISSDDLTTHGFRHIASTLLNEQGWPPDAIEKQLSHEDRNKIRATYNQAEYLDVRREMMQAWSDYLVSLM